MHHGSSDSVQEETQQQQHSLLLCANSPDRKASRECWWQRQATETQFFVSAAQGAIDGLLSKASGFREVGPRNLDSVFGTRCPSFCPLSLPSCLSGVLRGPSCVAGAPFLQPPLPAGPVPHAQCLTSARPGSHPSWACEHGREAQRAPTLAGEETAGGSGMGSLGGTSRAEGAGEAPPWRRPAQAPGVAVAAMSGCEQGLFLLRIPATWWPTCLLMGEDG